MLNRQNYSPQEISALCNNLSEERRNLAVSFLQYLWQQENQSKALNAQNAFSQIDALLGEQTIWQDEQQLIEELAEFRRHRE